MTQLIARNLKITLVLDPAQVAAQLAPLQRIERRIDLTFAVEGRTLRADFAPRAVRRCYAMIEEHGVDGVAMLVQGKLLRDDTIGDAGLVAQIKTPPRTE